MTALNTQDRTLGCKSLRNLELESTPEDVVYWSIDPAAGVIQGPLDLEFIRGKVLHLTVAPEQVALHFQQGRLRRVFMEGVHAMRVGRCEGDLPPESEMVFLAADRPLTLQWDQGEAVRVCGADGAQTKLNLRGSCTCHITGPDQFYAAFLSHAEGVGEPFTVRVIGTLILSLVERILREFNGQKPLEFVEIQSLATQLLPDDLNPVLARYGLLCSQLSLQPVPVPSLASAETSGQSAAVRVNRGH